MEGRRLMWQGLCGLCLMSATMGWGQTTPTTATLKVGEVDLARSRVFIFVGKTGLGHDHGVVGQLKSGVLHLGAKQQAGQLVFDMKTFVADTPEARRFVGLSGETDAKTRKAVTQNMLGADVLDAAKYPTATFNISSSLATAPPNAKSPPLFILDGQFTLHGVTKPLRLTIQVEEDSSSAHVRGGFSIRQTDFGITPYSKAFGAIGVADTLKIWGDLWVGATTQP